MENEIIRLIKEKGPLRGDEIQNEMDADPLLLWRVCHLSQVLDICRVGTRYLRLDRRIDGFARLSPSILREFLTYTAIGLREDRLSLEEKAGSILAHIEKVSQAKSDMAYSIVSTLVDRIGAGDLIKEKACFIIAGDIVFNMDHDVPRPERSTGKLVKGSDMDIVVVLDNRFPKDLMKRLDDEIFKEKYNYLISPYLREEIDYIVKYVDRVKEQLAFETFKHMVACKILQEGTLLFGSEEIFHEIKSMLKDNGVLDKLVEIEGKARLFREKAEKYLLTEDLAKIKEERLNQFYPSDESEEFE
jgi:hypothetical protein